MVEGGFMQGGYGELALAMVVPAAVMASWHDFRHHKVPNWLNVAIAAGGLCGQTLYGGWPGAQAAMWGLLVGFGMLIVLWAMRGMGAGDVKLMAAFGAWLGPQGAFYAVLVGGLLGGAMAVSMIAYQRRWMEASVNLGVLFNKVSRARTAFSEFGSAASMSAGSAVLPYAIPLSVGTVVVLVSEYMGWWGAL